MISISEKILEEMIDQAKSEYPNECCGILVGRRDGREKIVVRQNAVHNLVDGRQKKVHYKISPLELWHIEQFAREENLQIVGFYHSHPDYAADASPDDVKYMIPGYSYPIISVIHGTLAEIKSYEKTEFDKMNAEVEKIKIPEVEENGDSSVCVCDPERVCE